MAIQKFYSRSIAIMHTLFLDSKAAMYYIMPTMMFKLICPTDYAL